MGELRQNPTQMLDNVAAGETYVVTRHNREVARVVPTVSSATVVPPRRRGSSSTEALPRVDLPNGVPFDAFLDDLRGDR